jgi:multiple sugar transport system permease protein
VSTSSLPGRGPSALSRRWWSRSRRTITGILYVLPFAVVWAVFLVWPVVYGFYISLWQWDPLRGSTFVGLDNYWRLLNTERFINATYNTFYFAFLSIPLIVALGLLFAILLHGRRFPGKRVVEAGLFFPYLLNVSIVSLIWLWLMDSDFGILLVFFERLGWQAPSFLNHEAWVIPAIAIATAWWLMGYRMVIFQAALRDIPPSILEMAEIDGASSWQKAVHIMLPLIKPAILFTTVLTIIFGFQVMGQVLIMTQGGPGRSSEVLVLYLYRLGFDFLRMGQAAAVGFMLFVIILVLALACFRFLGLDSEHERGARR